MCEAPGLGVCKAQGAAVTAGRGSRRLGKTKSWVTREGAKKLELMRGAEPRLRRTPGVDLAEKSEGPRIPQPHSLRLQELLCLQLSLSLAEGWGPGGRGPNRCRAAAAPMGPARRGKGDRLQAWAAGRRRPGGGGERGPEVAGNQRWRPYLRIPERSVPGALSAGRLEVIIFDPPCDLCLKLAAALLPRQANLALGRRGLELTRRGKREEGRPAGRSLTLPCPRALLLPPFVGICWSRTCVSSTFCNPRSLREGWTLRVVLEQGRGRGHWIHGVSGSSPVDMGSNELVSI